ncbi:MAG: glycosyltransferase family protein [Candidatus Omnitrophica bacterium]|nr:glycosyltransferase family protein [Candidatus Omnitrophota bacterium]
MARKGKFVASIEARVGSTRLPAKVLREIMGRSMLELMIERVKKARRIDEIIVATSVNPKDDVLEQLALRMGVKCYRGSEEDVLSRVLEAVKSVAGDHIIELWGDTPLIDPAIIDDAVRYYQDNDFDCVGTDKGYPWGMSILIFPTAILEEVHGITNDPVDRENVSNYIYEHPQRYTISNLPCPRHLYRPEVRLTVDEGPDFEFVSRIFEALHPNNPYFDTQNILMFLDAHPELLEINKTIKQKKLRV